MKTTSKITVACKVHENKDVMHKIMKARRNGNGIRDAKETIKSNIKEPETGIT